MDGRIESTRLGTAPKRQIAPLAPPVTPVKNGPNSSIPSCGLLERATPVSYKACPDIVAAPPALPPQPPPLAEELPTTPGRPRPPSLPGKAKGSACALRGAEEAERALMQMVFARCDGFISGACHSSLISAEFLAALTANESGGNALAVRFEPSVYGHLNAVAAGERQQYCGITLQALREHLSAVAPSAEHVCDVNSPSASGQTSELCGLWDEALRDLASSWGFVQVMGFQVIGRYGTVRDLVEPHFHYQFATRLLKEFAGSFGLDVSSDFEKLFRCWNTGRPDGRTADPSYCSRGLSRMAIYRSLATGQRPERAPSLATRPLGVQ